MDRNECIIVEKKLYLWRGCACMCAHKAAKNKTNGGFMLELDGVTMGLMAQFDIA